MSRDMKRVLVVFCMVLGMLMIVASGCKQNDSGLRDDLNPPQVQEDTESIRPENEKDDQPAANNPPHLFGDFQGPGSEFSGGNKVTGYNLSSIRRVPHPQFIRLVFEFTGEDSGTAAGAPPLYVVKLEESSSRITVKLTGVGKADAVKDKNRLASLSDLIKDISFAKGEGDTSLLNIDTYVPVTCQVFDLENPARIVVVLNPGDNQAANNTYNKI